MTGLVYRDHFALSWRYAEPDVDTEHLERVNVSNEAFLRAVTAFGESSLPLKDSEEANSGMAQEIQRLDLKLNLLLDLVSSLIYRELSIPEPRLAEISPQGISWCCSEPPEAGRSLFLELYLQRGLPKPLCCYATAGEALTLQDQSAATAHFVGLNGPTVSWLEKWLFRQHRRQVASRRVR